MAKSVPPSSLEDYDYPDDEITIRMFPKLYRGKSDADSSVSWSIQKYWQNLMRNIPPLRWNMTNSLGNLFNAGAQELIETPVGNYQEVNRKRKRKSSKVRKSSAKKNKPRRRSHSRGHTNVYNYDQTHNPYNQLQLQSLGVDERNVMHFYEPKSGQYYALHLVSSPNQYQQQQYYSPQHLNYATGTDDDGDSYYGEDDYSNDNHGQEYEGHQEHDENESYEGHDHHTSSPDSEYHEDHQNYDNEYDKYAEAAAEPVDDYADDVQVADNWGYTDDDIFGERKLKYSLKPISFRASGDDNGGNKALTSSFIKLQKNLLKPETEEDVMLFLANKQKKNQRQHTLSPMPSDDEDNISSIKRIKSSSGKKSAEDTEIESVRNVLGSYMRDDVGNRKRQSSSTKSVKHRLVEKPRQRERYYFYPQIWNSPNVQHKRN